MLDVPGSHPGKLNSHQLLYEITAATLLLPLPQATTPRLLYLPAQASLYFYCFRQNARVGLNTRALPYQALDMLV